MQLLKEQDIQDWTKFRGVFQTTPQSSPVARISSLLPTVTKTLLAPTDSLQNEAKKQIIKDLNTILAMPDFYHGTAFASPETLMGEAKNLHSQLFQKPLAERSYHQVLRFNRLLLEAAFPDISKSTFYVLQPIPASHYWFPNEPVVLIADETAKQTPRHGQDGRLHEDGLLECQTVLLDAAIAQELEKIATKIKSLNPILKSIEATQSAKDQLNRRELPQELQGYLSANSPATRFTVSTEAGYWLVEANNQEYTVWEEQGKLNLYKVRIGFSNWTEQPWHPFLLEWEVEVLPLKGKYRDQDSDPNIPAPLTRNYDSDCITQNYQLAEDAVDLAIKPGQETLAKEVNIYIGRSILTPHAQIQLKQQIDDLLEKELLGDYYEAQKIPASERTDSDFEQNRDKIIDWYQKSPNKDKIVEQILAIDGKVDLISVRWLSP